MERFVVLIWKEDEDKQKKFFIFSTWECEGKKLENYNHLLFFHLQVNDEEKNKIANTTQESELTEMMD